MADHYQREANLTLISDAKETKINRLSITSGADIPVQLSSENVVLCQTAIEANGIAMVSNHDAELNLYGTVSVTSNGVNALFCKNTRLKEVEGNLETALNVTGNICVCGAWTDEAIRVG